MPLVIAEIGTSHEGSVKKAKMLIDEAVSCGADVVKFQWVYADEILHPKTGFVKLPGGDIPLFERFKMLECSKDFYSEMKDYAHSKNVKFACSPFGLRSLSELYEIKPDYIKIASPELNHYPLLRKLRKMMDEDSSLNVIVSSGVSTLKDIEKALEILGTKNVTLLHCITSYPAPEDEYNLKLITNLSNIFGLDTGISDHSLDPVLVPVLSVLCGAKMIEKHITLSRKTSGLDDPVALEGEMFALMCHVVHQTEALLNRYGREKGRDEIFSQLSQSYDKERIFKCLGDGVKHLSESEKANYGRTNRSLHYMKDLKKGEIITEDDVKVLRTEKILKPGISPEFLENVIGRIVHKDVFDGDGVEFSDF